MTSSFVTKIPNLSHLNMSNNKSVYFGESKIFVIHHIGSKLLEVTSAGLRYRTAPCFECRLYFIFPSNIPSFFSLR